MTSESQFGIMEQPRATCPLINSVISSGKLLIDRIPDGDSYDFKWFKEECEEIRNNVGDIRSWGQEWKVLAKDLHSEVREMESKVKDLEDEKEDLERMVRKLEEELSELQCKLP
jgi:predicted nuclease with TOPRIM domain